MFAWLALNGYATLSNVGGLGPDEQTGKDRLCKEVKRKGPDADRDAIDKSVARLLEQPLSIEDSVRMSC